MAHGMQYRFATGEDAALLAPLNQQLIHDEGHHNSMTLAEFWRSVGFREYCVTMEAQPPNDG